MKEKQWYAYSTPEGPINLIEGDKMPPSHHSEGWYKKYCESHNHASPELSYQADLQAAKKSSVPIQDHERATRIIQESIGGNGKGPNAINPYGIIVPADRIYGPFTVEYRIEDACAHDSCPVDAMCEHCKEPVKVAILYDDTPEKELQPIDKYNLLPCPFCGSQPEWINEAIPDSHFYIKCPNCHIVMKEDRRDKVIGMWNTRSSK